jgi:hypothetical protein
MIVQYLVCRWVDLSHCTSLHNIQPHAFSSILRLETLSLAHTGLSGLPPEAVPVHLGRLELAGVRLACTCAQLAWLVTASTHGVITTAGGPTCQTPGRLAGRLVASLSPADLGCGAGSSSSGYDGRAVGQHLTSGSGSGELLVIVGIVCAGALVSTLGENKTTFILFFLLIRSVNFVASFFQECQSLVIHLVLSINLLIF